LALIELHYLEYPSCNHPPQDSSLEDTLKAFIQSNSQILKEIKNVTMVNSQSIHEIKDAAMANTEEIARLERQLGHLVAEFNKIEKEELQSQEMAREQYMIDEDGPNNSYLEHVQATTFGSEEVVKETVNEPSLEDPLEACLAQFGDDLDLDKLLEQADAILDPTTEVRTKMGKTTEISFPNSSSLVVEPFIVDNHEEEEKKEQVEQIEPLPTPKLSNDMEVSTEAPSFIIVSFETHHETQGSILQCLKEPSHAQCLKDLCTQDHKSRNHGPKRILQSKQLGYLRWRNILPEGYQILKKKRWKGFVGHPSDQGKCGIFSFLFFALYF
jgi:hypothetical protein